MTGARRHTARGAALATAVLLGGMIPGAQAASGVQEIDVELAYTCDFPQGEQPVKVGITATIPESALPGQAIQPEDVVLDVTLPEGALTGSADSAAATVSAEMRLAVDVAQKGQEARAEWIGTTADASPIPSEGELPLSTSGAVPYVRPGAPGDLSLTAARLTGVLTTRTADGAPTEPATTDLACVLDADQDPALATVDVAGEPESSAPAPSPSADWPGEDEEKPAADAPEVGARAEEPRPADAPPCVGDPDDQLNMVAYVTGYANVAKLNGASRFPLACGQITQGPSRLDLTEPGFMHVYQDSTVDLDYQGKTQLPPSQGTFLTFGFMPTTATLEMTQIPTETRADGTRAPNIKSDLAINLADFSSRNVTAITLELMLRLRDVEVNGVPLDVGDNCRTSRPFTLTLNGLGTFTPAEGSKGYTLATGGELTGSVTLPPFSGCGVDEDLDNLFTASLSGVPGYVKQVQGAPCAAAQGSGSGTPCTTGYEPVDVPKAAR
ncbi:DUF6801 domain-containing protein [Streptomyces sp. 24-1644]|uniref:DUF6801 domain-containing protein n=1 Tax=Streptomyces sp. 24-1644 TaxID=3457315 RepID=UPI003FA6D1A9